MPCARADRGLRASILPATRNLRNRANPDNGEDSPRRASPAAGTSLPQPGGRSAAEAAVPAGIRPQGPEEVDVTEVRPVRLAEVELRGRALPQQEAAEALLTGRADDEVGVGLALGVEVPGDVLDGELGRDLLDGLALRGAREQQVAHGVGDLAATAVADGDVDRHAVGVPGPLGRGAEARGGLGWQQLQGADDLEVPVAGVGEVGDGRLD